MSFVKVHCNSTHRSRNLVPGFLQPVDGRVRKGSANLQHSVEVVQTPANVRHGSPLLDGGYPRRHVAPAR